MNRLVLTLLLLTLAAADARADEPRRRVYVPIEDLDVVIERDQRGVLLDKAEFEKLQSLAEAEAEKRPKPPAAAFAWTKAAYQARAVDDQLVLTLRAELEQFAPGWQQIVVPMTRVALENAKLDGEPALIGRGEQGALVFFLQRAGTHVLEMQLSTELASLGADRVAAFGIVPAPAGSLTMTVPAGKRLEAGGWQLPRPQPLENPADYKIAVGGHDSLHLRITDRATDKHADVLVFASTGYGLHAMPGEVSWHALTTLQVFGKPLDRLTLSMPNTLEIADVESSGLESWQLADDPERADHVRLTLSFRQPFEGERKIHFKGVMATPPDVPWTVPTLTIANVTSHVGQVIVQYPAGVRLQTMEAQGVRRATVDQQPASDMPIDMGQLQAVEQWRYDFWQPDFTLRFLTQPRQRDVQTAVAAVLDVNTAGLELSAAITVKTRFAPLFDVDLQLPAEWTLLAASRDGQTLSWQTVSQEAGKHLWRISLSPQLPVEGTTTLQLSIRREVEDWPIESDPLTVDLPELLLPQSNLHEGTLVVRGDEEFNLAALEIVGLDAVPLKADYERLRFQSQDTRYSGKLRISRKPSRVAAESLSFTRLDPQTLHTFLQALVEVQGGGVRSLNIELPESTGPSLRFFSPGGPRIVEQTPSASHNGSRIWTLQFDRRVSGRFPLIVDIEQPRGDGDQWTVPEWRFVDADRQNGFIAIEASGEQRLGITAESADGTPLAEVDPLDVPTSIYVPKERIIAVYRTVVAGARVTLDEQRFAKEPIPTAVCRVLSMQTVAAETGELQHRAEFALDIVGVQSLSLSLPADAQLWAALVDGRPVEVRQGKDVHLIPLPGPSTRSERKLELYYQSRGKGFDESGKLEQTPPVLAAVTGTGADQPVVVLQQTWKLHHPRETLLVDSDGSLEPTSPLDEPGWLARWHDRLRRPTWQELGMSFLYALIAVVLIVLPILAVRRFGAQRILMYGAAAVCVMILIGLMLPAVQQSREAARRSQVRSLGDAAPESAPAAAMSMPPGAPMEQEADAPRRSGPVILNGPMGGERDKSAPMARFANEPESPRDAEEFTRRARLGSRDARTVPAKEAEQLREELNDLQGLANGKPPVAARQPADQPQAAPPENAKDAHVGVDPGIAGPPADEARQAFGEDVGRLGETPGAKIASGLLSLALDLTPPSGSRVKEFRYVGQGTTGVGAPLSLTFARRSSRTTLTLFLVALFALIAWLQRKATVAWKIAVAVIGVAAPWGLVLIAPQGVQNLLDGVFFGTIAAVAIWAGEALCTCCDRCCGWRCGTKTTGIAAIALGGLIGGGSVDAQETPAKPSAPIVVVPYEAGADPTASERILLPHETFLKLWQEAHPDLPAPAPIDGGLVEALYAATLDAPPEKPNDAVVRFTARYVIRSYVDGQLSVTLPLGTVALSSAKLDGKSAVVAPKDSGYVALIPSAGLHALDLEFSVPAKLSGSTGQFTLPLKAVPSGRLSFQLPAKDLLVRINGSTSAYRRSTDGDATSIELPIDQAGELTVAWQPPQAKGGGAAVVHVESATAVSIRDAGVTLSVGLNYRVRQGTIQDVRFAFPSSLKLQNVAGPDLGGWELQETPDGRSLRILFRRAVNDQTQLGVTLFLDQNVDDEPATVAVPSLTPLDVTNEVGAVAIFAGEQFQATAGETSGLTQIDAANYQPPTPIANITSPPRLAYRFVKRPFALSLQVSRQAAQGQLTALHAVSVMRRKIQSTSRFHYQLTGAPRSVLRFELPKDFLPLEIKATLLADWYVDNRGESPLLIVQLARPLAGAVETVVTGSRPRDPNGPTAEIALPQPLDVSRVESTLAVWTDEAYAASVQSSDGWRAIDANAAGPEIQRLRPTQAVRFAFQASGAPTKPVIVQLVRGEPRLQADTLVTTTVTEFTVVHALALQWQIDGSAVDSLSLTTPKFLSGRLDFQGSDIREVTESDAGDDRVRWTVWFRTPVSGKYFATALAALPPASTEVVVPAILCELPAAGGELKPVENQRQYVLMINGSQSQLSLVDASAVEPVLREDLPIAVRQEQIDQGTELVRLKDWKTAPVWTLRKFAHSESIAASVNVADLTTVIARDGTYRTQAVYTIRNRRRQFLALRLPENSLLLSVVLNNQPSRCVTATVAGSTAHLVALPKTSEADLSFPVKIVIAGRLAQPLPRKARFSAQEIVIPAPQVIGQGEDAAFGIPVARTRWTVHLADDLDVRAVTDPRRHNLTLTPEGASELVYAAAAVQELSELLDVVEGSSNSRQKRRAAENVRQLGDVVRNYRSTLGRSASPQQAAEFREQEQKVVERFNKLQRELDATARGEAATQPSSQGQSALNFNDQSDVLNFAIQGNGVILRDNPSQVRGSNEAVDDNFQFSLQQLAIPKSETAEQPAPQQQSDFQTRGAYQRTNEANLGVLNSIISEKKGGRQGGFSASTESRADDLPPNMQQPIKGNLFNVQPGHAILALPPASDADEAVAPQFGISKHDASGAMAGNAGINMEGMMGGLGGGGVWTGWTQAGGLSLPIDVPTTGQKLVYTKVGGDPKLALSIRPKATLRFGMGLFWTAASVIVALALASAVSRRHLRQGAAAWTLVLVGIIGWCLLPGVVSAVALLALVAGAAMLVWTVTKTTPAA